MVTTCASAIAGVSTLIMAIATLYGAQNEALLEVVGVIL